MRGGKNQVTPQEIGRNNRRDKRDGGGAVVGKGGRRPCLPQPLNVTMVKNIFHHGDPLISHNEPPNTPFTLSSSPGPIHIVCPIFIPHPVFMYIPSYVSVSNYFYPYIPRVYPYLSQTISDILPTK